MPKAELIISSPIGISHIAQENVHVVSGQNTAITSQGDIQQTSQQHIQLNAQQGISLFSEQQGIKIYNAQSDLQLQSQSGRIEQIARQSIDIISTEDEIRISSPKKLVLTGESSQIELSSEGILLKTMGKFEVKAEQHLLLDGESTVFIPPNLCSQNFLELNYHWPDLEPMYKAPYVVVFENGQRFEGNLDEQGYAKIEGVPKNQSYEIWYGEDQRNIIIESPKESRISKMTKHDILEFETLLKQRISKN